MPDTVQGEFPFANDFRVAIRVSKAALVADVPEEAILGLVSEGKLDSMLVNSNPDSPRKHRRILANSLWKWMGRAWRYEINRHEDAFGKGWFRRLFRLFALARDWSRTP